MSGWRIWLADKPRPVLLAPITSGLPEGHRGRIILGDDRGEPDCALLAQALLACREQHRREPLAAVLRRDSQPVEAPTPPVPRGDQRADQDATALGDQQRLGVGGQQPGESLGGVADARQAARRCPQVEHGGDVRLAGAANHPVIVNVHTLDQSTRDHEAMLDRLIGNDVPGAVSHELVDRRDHVVVGAVLDTQRLHP